MTLFNKETIDTEDLTILIEQYKLYVEMADRISQRRMTANTFFISVHTLLFAVTSFVNDANLPWKIVVGVLGCILCFAWYSILSSYRKLNSCKYKTIHEIESLLPLSAYTHEWQILTGDKRKVRYWPFSRIEKTVPILFAIAYIASIIYVIVSICGQS